MNRFALGMLLALVFLTAMAVAQGSGSTEPNSNSAPNKPTDSNFTVTRILHGSIITVNPGTKELVVKDSMGKLHTLKVVDETKYQAGAKSLALQDLRAGQKVKVVYRANDSTALQVRLAPLQSQRSQ